MQVFCIKREDWGCLQSRSITFAKVLGLSQRTVRGLIASWLADGWLEVADPSRKARRYL